MFLSRVKAALHHSTVRQTLGLLALFCFITIVAWGGTFLLVRGEMLRAVDARLTSRMDAVVAALEQGEMMPASLDGQTAERADRGWVDGFETVDSEGPRSIEFRYLVRTTAFGQIRLGENTERQEELRDILAGGMQLTLAGVLLASAIAGLWLTRRSQARFGQINDGLAKIAKGHLDTRIQIDGPDDDLTLLSHRINATAERLEGAITQMRVQSSNIAHDLRTPLARLRAQIETNLIGLVQGSRPVSEEDLGEALEQIDQITATFEALLRLARIESGAGRQKFRPVQLDALVSTVAETFAPVVESIGASLEVDVRDPATISGDWDMLVQLFANLIQNAVRHASESNAITVRIQGSGISVVDEGPGIPFAERQKVLQPLYQQQTTRQNDGLGLGLSLVRAIADLHGATLALSDGAHGRGLTVSVRFPQFTEL